MEAIIGTLSVAQIVTAVAGSVFTLTLFAGLIALVYFGGMYYAVPRWALKFWGQSALSRN
jgi:hypothetical protein